MHDGLETSVFKCYIAKEAFFFFQTDCKKHLCHVVWAVMMTEKNFFVLTVNCHNVVNVVNPVV